MPNLYYRNTGSTIWALASNWSLTDGGGATGSIPTQTDDVFFTVNSGNCSLTNNSDCRNLTFNGYTGTYSQAFFLRIYGNILFSTTAFTLSGGSDWQIKAGGTTIQTNGKILPYNLRIAHAGVTNTTLLSNTTVASYIGEMSGNTTGLDGFTLFINGSIQSNQANRPLRGTTNLVMQLTGAITTLSTAAIQMNLTINTTGTVTFSGAVYFNGNTLTYIPNTGNVVTTGSTLVVDTATTLNTIGINWNTILFNGTSATLTLTTDLYCNQFNFGVNSKTINGANIYNAGSLTDPGNVGNTQGTSTMIMNGTGTIASVGGYTGINVTIDTLGTITLGNFRYGFKTFKYVKGTVIPTGTLTFEQTPITINATGMTFLNLSSGTSASINLIAPLTATGVLTVANGHTLNFINTTNGFTVGGITVNSGTLILAPAPVIYTVTTNMVTTAATLAARGLIRCSTVNGTKAILNLAPGATQDNGYVSATDIDSSGGRSIWSYKGLLTRTINWNVMSTNPKKHILKFGSKILK